MPTPDRDVGMSAVHYDLFMAERVTGGGYADALETLAASRKLPPNTESEIHLAVAAAHPLLYAAHAELHPGQPRPAKHPPPATTFRGVRCVRCGTVVDEPTAIAHGSAQSAGDATRVTRTAPAYVRSIRDTRGRHRLDLVTRPTPDPRDRVLVLIEQDGPVMSVDDWLAALDDDPPTEVEVNAAQILREMRTQGER